MQGKMDVREAVKKAKEGLATIFEGEGVSDLRLEEITFSQGPPTWNVTISFRRPSAFPLESDRTFKVVHISDLTGELRSVSIRNL